MRFPQLQTLNRNFGPTGYFRERLETLYWNDYPAGLGRSNESALYPTPYCSCYGAMRDRIRLAAVDPLPSSMVELPPATLRETRSHRWRIAMPQNLTALVTLLGPV